MKKTNQLRRACFLILSFCFVLIVGAQEKTISGTVTSQSDGSVLPGVNVIVKGTSIGTSTDFDGNYTIDVNGDNVVLVFSYVGYSTFEATVGSSNRLDVQLKEDLAALEEVVVVGYGARRKSDVTGSVSSVKSDELTAFPVLDAEQALQGRAAGVNVQSNNGGEPGAPISISIRGNTSINASSSPLIVVDGFVGANMPQAGDIESLQVLKDASATAIYGSRGSNGVILVTTKKGRSGKLNVEFNSTYAIQNTSNSLDLLNANDFADYQNQIRANQGNTTPYPQGTANTDWQDEIYRSGNTSNNQLSFSGGSEKVNYYASGTYFTQDGILVNSGYERVAFLSNIDAQVTDKLKLGLNLVGSINKKNGVATQSTGADGVGAGGDDVVSLAMRFAPDKGIYNADGSFSINDGIGDPVDNPWAVATQRDDDTETERFRANFYANYEIIEGLTFKTTFGLSTDNDFRGLYLPRTLQITAGGVGGRAIMTEDKTKTLLSENYLTYNKEIGKGNLTLLAGYSYQKTTNKGFYSEGTGTISDSFSYYGLWTATNLLNGGSGDIYINETEIQSQFGRINYDWNDKYLLTATVRRDGASNFAENEKYAIFPSAALGWKISNEDFLNDNETISNLKLRLSYGVTGNPSIGAYQSLASLASIYASNNGSTVAAVTPNQPANPDLKWESSYQTNVGVDLGLLNNKISLSLDYYNIDTEDLIMIDRGLPWYLGFYNDQILKNVGEINNKGFEISLNTRNITTDDFSWTTDAVFARNKNSVEKLINGDDYFQNGAPSYFSVGNNVILREGEEVGQFFGFDYAGVYQGGTLPEGTATIAGGVAGDPLFLDLDDSGDITNDDRQIIGNPNPDFTWGITNSFRYKNFDANIFFQGSQGGEIFNMTNVQLTNGDANTTYDYFNNAWTPSNTDTNQPRVGNNSFREISSRFVEDGSYIRLKNIAVGYNFPSEAIEKLGIERLRLSVSAQNLLTITNYSGLDPEVNYFGSAGNNNTARNTVRGFDFGNYPTVKSVNFSLNVIF
ncbi:TonB-linked outer membrane protein, SusC/RagA family [Hyunsoonleella jejuensis]|uniref:TonB-linked outer membrane protein, SusC/RagA family n=1 Tax=Hyunsoonleella jejuensis TaxID=419940 RepID=A0A1H9KQ44_9FLAO|nr:TonB-dependent receptor [Hyunsoonleella jejuensis]SER01276.1 TonB-linked outer membrane protein, SusC/RagA family [Hyunsoonleella jejuensis]